MTKILKKIAIVSLILLTLSCSFAPKYQRPAIVIPEHYKEEHTWKKVSPHAAEVSQGEWWKIFGDETLNQLETEADFHNQTLKASFARYKESRAVANATRAAYFPNISTIFNADRQHISGTTSTNSAPAYSSDFYLGVDVSYEVDLWGRVKNAVISNDNLAKAALADFSAVQLNLQANLAANYFALRGADAVQRVLNATTNAYQHVLNLIEVRHKDGIATAGDVQQAISALENVKTISSDNQLRRSQLEHAIAVLVGKLPAEFSLPPAIVKMHSVYPFRELPSKLLERRPDIAAAERRVIAANAQIGVAQAAFFPNVNLESDAGFESALISRLVELPSLFWALGPATTLVLTKPLANLILFDGGYLKAKLDQANATYYETVANYRQTVLAAFQEVEDNLAAMRQLKKENISQNAATIAAYKSLVQSIDRYKGGVATYLDIFVTQNAALQYELTAVNIATRRQIANVQLIKALGGNWELGDENSYT
jgi:NodT family efflux transporter outer membrane factor (OMF) lipoprotein